MAAAELPMPPDLFVDDAPPLGDDDLDRLFAAAEHVADTHDVPYVDGLAVLASDVDVPELPAAQRAARWEIADEREAAWAAAKFAEATAEIDRLAEQADDWRQRIDAWFAQAARRYGRTAGFMEQRLGEYGLRVREAGGPATIPLPSATIKTTARQARVEVDDDATVALVLDTALGDPPPDADEDTLAAYRAWRDAWVDLVDGATEPVRLVERRPKVFVAALRQLVRPAEVIDGWWATATLACGHTLGVSVSGTDDPDLLTPGEFVVCSACDPDPIDGAVEQPVAVVEVEPVLVLAAVGPDGAAVPGMSVRAAETTATVEVRR